MFKRILFSFFIGLSIYSPAFAGLHSERFFDNTGGLIDRYSPILVPVKSASDIQNIHLDERGQLLKRRGYSLNNTTDLTHSTTTGAGYHQSTTGTSFFAVIVGTNIFTTGNTFGGTYTTVTGTITLTNNINNLAQFTNISDYGVFCNESDPPIQVRSGSAFRIPNVSTGAKTCEGYNNYLLIGNLVEGTVTFGSRLRWSDLGAIGTWPSNNYIDIEPDDGDSIVAIKRYQNNLYVFKKHSIYEAIQTGGAGAEAFIVRPIARGIGAWAKNSVKAINTKGIVFLGSNGVYLFDGNNFDFISDQIQHRIDGLNRTRYTYAVGEVYSVKNQYLLSITDGVDIKNSTILAWDYIQQAWSVYSGIKANTLASAEDSDGHVVLFSGDYNGDIYKQDTGTTDNPNGASTPIASFYASPHLHFGTPELDKTFKYLYIFSKATTVTDLTIDIGYNFQDSYRDNKVISIGGANALWGSGIWGTDAWPGTSVQVQRIEINRTGKAIKFKFSDNSDTQLGVLGYVVVYAIEDYQND